MYKDIQCAFAYKSSKKFKNDENETTHVANNPHRIICLYALMLFIEVIHKLYLDKGNFPLDYVVEDY